MITRRIVSVIAVLILLEKGKEILVIAEDFKVHVGYNPENYED